MKNARILLLLIPLFILFSCSATNNIKQHTVTGRLLMTGNHPFTRLSLEINTQELLIISKDSPVYKELLDIQTKTIEATYVLTENEEILVKEFKIYK